MRMVAVVLGGGTGQRIGAPLPKQLLKLGGRTLLEHCVAAFEQAPGVDEILVVMAGDYVEQARDLLAGHGIQATALRQAIGAVAAGVVLERSRSAGRDAGALADLTRRLEAIERQLAETSGA